MRGPVERAVTPAGLCMLGKTKINPLKNMYNLSLYAELV